MEPNNNPCARRLRLAGNATIPATSIRNISTPSHPRVTRKRELGEEIVLLINSTCSWGGMILMRAVVGTRIRSSTKNRSKAVPREASKAPIKIAKPTMNFRANPNGVAVPFMMTPDSKIHHAVLLFAALLQVWPPGFRYVSVKLW